MKRFLLFAGIATASLVLALTPTLGQQPASSQQELVNKYCVTCHNEKAKTGGLVLEKVDATHPELNAELWEKVIRKVRAGLMPPAGANRPERAVLENFRATLESSIDKTASAKPNPGVTALHRLNRTEYANAVRDLIAVDVDVSTILPADDSSEGLDNIADVLGTSPALIERYVGAAAKISRLAVGDTDISPLSTTYKVRGDLSQDKHIPGLPVGTRGGIVIKHNFPVDGEYQFKFSLLKVNFGPNYGGAAKGEQIEMSLNGERVGLLNMRSVPYYYIRGGAQGGPATPLEIRLPVKAGPQTIIVTFIKRTSAGVDDLFQRFDATTADLQTGVQYGYTTFPHLSSVEIIGPYDISGPGDTPSRKRIFVCKPASAAEEPACAKKIVANLARHAYRRAVTDADVEPLLNFYRSGRQGPTGTFERGVEMALRRVLADPQFVFRFERDPANLPAGSAHRISDIELASRLSFFIWSSIPDEELLAAAEQGKLKNPAVLQQQVKRMLKDSRSEALINNFADQWLFLRELKNRNPDLLVYPDFDDNLRQAFQRETELLFDSIVREDRNVFDILNADYTFLNERLARHYGVPSIYGSDFRRVTIEEKTRRGLLGQGSFLMVTSSPNRTSPVTRGAWILENLLGSPPPSPPPNVPPLPENTNGQGVTTVPTSVRERMIAHRANQPCKGCHQIMDPIGLALENFDGVGRWRNADSGSKIDASGQLVDGTPIDGVETLRSALLNRPDAFVQTMTEKLLMYAVGRASRYYDMPAIRTITHEASRNNYKFSSLVLGIVNSDAFQMRVKKAEETAQ
jgi:cytochrome c551/c552